MIASEVVMTIVDQIDRHNTLVEQRLDDFISLLKETNNVELNLLPDLTDQEISDCLEALVEERVKDTHLRTFTYIKSSLFAEKMGVETLIQEAEEEKRLISHFLRSIGLPSEMAVTKEDGQVILRYDFSSESELRKKIDEILQWSRDKVIETFSSKFNIPVDNVCYIENISEYLNFISSFDSINYVSRGQKDCKYSLVPSLHRIHKNNYKSHSSNYESIFKQKVIFYDKTLESKDTEELRAYAQHFGLPTNYLDFTEAHLISLLFAVEQYSYNENHSVVYFVDALSHNKEVIRDEIKLVDFSDKELKSTKERTYSDKSYFIRVGNSSERIHFQKGCFLKIEPGDNLNGMLEKHTRVAIIDKDSKKSILTELFNLGINFENIYPDKDNMVKTIKFMYEEI